MAQQVDVDQPESLFAKRIRRRAEVATLLSGLYAELAECRVAEIEGKAGVYLRLLETTQIAHGERQARAAHEVAGLDAEVKRVLGQIDSLREERDLLNLLIEYDVGT